MFRVTRCNIQNNYIYNLYTVSRIPVQIDCYSFSCTGRKSMDCMHPGGNLKSWKQISAHIKTVYIHIRLSGDQLCNRKNNGRSPSPQFVWSVSLNIWIDCCTTLHMQRFCFALRRFSKELLSSSRASRRKSALRTWGALLLWLHDLHPFARYTHFNGQKGIVTDGPSETGRYEVWYHKGQVMNSP